MSEEKTEKPTAKRLKEARKEGQVPRTPELGAWASVLALTLVLPIMVSSEVKRLRDLLMQCLELISTPDTGQALQLLGKAGGHVLLTLGILGSAIMLVGVASALAQGGFYLATKSTKPSFSKLNLIKGAKRIFGPQALWEGAKMLLKSSFAALIVYLVARSMVPLIGGFVPMASVIEMTSGKAIAMLRNVALLGLVMAGADYAMKRRQIGKQIRMSKHDIKQEHKQTEGDPLVKSAIRGRQLAAARNRMMANVAEADVVLVNPTHVAVALRYEAARGAPRVVARGAGAIAAKIRERAEEARVPLVRDIPLARALHRSTEVGQEIPPELFTAVAQVLAFVISRRTQGQRGGEHRSPRREEPLPEVRRAGRRRRTPSTEAPGTAPPNLSTPALGGR